MCVQFAFCHQLWINTWRSKFEQDKDSVLLACWFHELKSQGSWGDWLVCTTSCTTPAQCMEETSRRSIGSTSILLLRKDWHSSIEFNHLCRTLSANCIPNVVRMEIGEVYMSSQPPLKISLKHHWTWVLGSEHVQRENFGIWKLPIEPTNCKSHSWQHTSRDHCARWKKNVPFSGDWCWFFSRRNCFFRENGETRHGKTRLWNTNAIQARSSEDRKDFNVEQGIWANRAICHHARRDQCVRQFSNTFCSWKGNVQRWRQNTSWENAKTGHWSWYH